MTRRAMLALAAVLGALLVASCAPPNSDPSAAYFPKTRTVASTPAPVDPALTAPPAPIITAVGEVSRPNVKVTPGAVAVHDVSAICASNKHVVHPPVPASWDVAIYNEYSIAAKDQGKYQLDFLVPLEIGGAPTLPNLWPVSMRGIGFHEKQRLNARLRTAVCQGLIPLNQAQSGVVSDWFALWTRYAAY